MFNEYIGNHENVSNKNIIGRPEDKRIDQWKSRMELCIFVKQKTNLSNMKNNDKIQCSANTSEFKYTCYSSNSLHKLKKYWNIRHPDREIKTNDNKEIWKVLKHNMQNACKNEACWLKQLFIKNNLDQELLSHTFAPYSPKTWNVDPYTWLTSVDIDNVMQQYEKELHHFEFIGPSPIDFDKKKAYG